MSQAATSPTEEAPQPAPPVVAEPLPEASSPETALGSTSSGTGENPASSSTEEALKRLTTVDLENGSTPGSFAKCAAGLQQPSKTTVLVKVGDNLEPVLVTLTPDQCRAAGFMLLGDSQKPDPVNHFQTQNQAAMGYIEKKPIVETNPDHTQAPPPAGPPDTSAVLPTPPLAEHQVRDDEVGDVEAWQNRASGFTWSCS